MNTRSEERLALLMNEIFQEEFKKQERNILNIVSGNFEITMNEIKNLKQEISELKSSLDFTEDVLEKKVEKLEENMKDVDARVRDIYEYQANPNYVRVKLAGLEDRSRRNNLCIDGINEEKGKAWEMCETKIKNIFQEKLEIHDDMIIERAHRTKGKTTWKNTAGKKRPRTIVIKLNNCKHESVILRNVHKPKGSDIFINEDFSKQTTDFRKELWKEVKQLRSEGKVAYLNYRTVVTKKRNNEGQIYVHLYSHKY